MYEVKEPFWLFVDNWQTLAAALIAGGLALGAAALTVWAAIRSANRQVRAANEAADRQIKAAADAADRQVAAAREQTQALADAADRQVAAARRQVTALKDQIQDARTARRQDDERRLSVIKWAIRVEGRRLEAATSTLLAALPSAQSPANRSREQLIIESSPLLRGERAEISLLDDQTRRLLEELAGIIDEYNSRIQTAVFLVQGPLIEQKTRALLDRLAEVVQEIQSVL